MNTYIVKIITKTIAKNKNELLKDIMKEIPDRYLMFFKEITVEENNNENPYN